MENRKQLKNVKKFFVNSAVLNIWSNIGDLWHDIEKPLFVIVIVNYEHTLAYFAYKIEILAHWKQNRN